jgi:hypothetical protein
VNRRLGSQPFRLQLPAAQDGTTPGDGRSAEGSVGRHHDAKAPVVAEGARIEHLVHDPPQASTDWTAPTERALP